MAGTGLKKKLTEDEEQRNISATLRAYIKEKSSTLYTPLQKKIDVEKGYKAKVVKLIQRQKIIDVPASFSAAVVYNIAQLTTYVYFIKLILYTHARQQNKVTRKKDSAILSDSKKLNSSLISSYPALAQSDYCWLFENTILDELIKEEESRLQFIPLAKKLIQLNYSKTTADIIGEIYHSLAGNDEQHKRGQHFTNGDEVNLINAFCIKKHTDRLIDTGCGAGAFLVGAYNFLKHENKKLTQQQLVDKIYGIEISTLPALLSVINIIIKDKHVSEKLPNIIPADFKNIHTIASRTIKEVKKEKSAEITLPLFDVCIGNPPFIRQENIDDKKGWQALAKEEFGSSKISGQSDLYVYYLMHTAAFLKEGGKLGYVIASSWLDTSFGAGLQKFLLDNFKIIAIIDQESQRSFSNASVNTVVLIAEKCVDKKLRDTNKVKFVKIRSDYEEIIGGSSYETRIEKAKSFASKIEQTNRDLNNEQLQITVITQQNLEEKSTRLGLYENGYWGANYFRAPAIYQRFIKAAGEKLMPLSDVVEVKYGIKTGANQFFYLRDVTAAAKELSDQLYFKTFGFEKKKDLSNWKKIGWFYSDMTKQHHLIEREYIAPLFKTQKEAAHLDANASSLKYSILLCADSKTKLKADKKQVLDYIEIAEQKPFEIQKRPSCNNGKNWYDITSKAAVGDFIFPSKIGEKYRLIDNRKAKVSCDKVNYVFTIRPGYKKYSDEIFLLLNSITFRFFIELFARQLTGSQTLSDVDVNLVKRTLVLNPRLLSEHKTVIKQIYKSLKNRPQGKIAIEVKQEDKKNLDGLIMSLTGLPKTAVTELYHAAEKYVADRERKSASL